MPAYSYTLQQQKHCSSTLGPGDVGGHCFYYTGSGCRFGPDHGRLGNWVGMQDASVRGDRVSMLLDLDQGSMRIFKNDTKLGVIQAAGLSGPLCWAAEMGQSSAHIESGPHEFA